MRTRHLIACGLAALSLAAAGCGEEESGLQGEPKEKAAEEESAGAEAQAPPAASGELKGKPKVTVPKGAPPKKLEVKDLVVGKDAAARSGSQMSVNYVGVAYSTGKEFDNSYDRGEPFLFQLGAGMVIPGWDEGLVGMKVGGRRQLTIPPELAYGAEGSPPAIKGGETLTFVIDLLGVK